MTSPEALSRLRAHVAACAVQPLFAGVVVSHHHPGVEVRFAAPSHQVVAFRVTDLRLCRDARGTIRLETQDEPEPDLGSVLPAGMVVAIPHDGDLVLDVGLDLGAHPGRPAGHARDPRR